jgi:hypothetical protein
MKDVHSNNVDSVLLNIRYLCLSSLCIVLHCSSVIPPFFILSVMPPHCSPLFFGYIDPFTFISIYELFTILLNFIYCRRSFCLRYYIFLLLRTTTPLPHLHTYLLSSVDLRRYICVDNVPA